MWKKYILRSLVFCILLIFTLQDSLSASGQDGGGFSDTFDDATLPGWEHSQDVQVVDGVLQIDPENFAFRLGSWANPDLSIRIRCNPPGGVEVIYHASENGAYHVRLFAEGDHFELFLDREEGGTTTNLGSSPASNFVAGDWNTLQIVLRNGQHQVTLNGSLLITANEDMPLTPGSIGLSAHGENTAEFDDITVSTVADAAPAIQEGPVDQVEEPAQQPAALSPASVLTTPLVTPQPGAGTRSILEELFTSGANPLDLQTFVINLGLAAVLSFILGRVYIHWGASLSNRR